MFARNLAEPITEYSGGDPATFKVMTFGDLTRFRDPVSFLPEWRISTFAHHLETGRVGVMALADGRLAGYGWASTKNEVDDWLGVELSLQEGEGYIFDGFLFPAFRHRGIYPALMIWRLQYLRQIGCKIAYSLVLASNIPARKWHHRMGFTAQHELGWLRVMGVRRHMSRSLESPGIRREAVVCAE